MRDKTGVRWGRVIVAGLLTEIGVVLIIVAAVTVYRYAASPTEAEYQAFADRAGFYVGTCGGALLAFLFSSWVCRSLGADFILNGLLVGCVGVLLHVALFVASGAGFQKAYLVADGLKLAAGALGGYLARGRYSRSTESLPQ
ncbi:MAG: hypothetical protein LC785_07230 [Acidobacteria bacterium]|nr:hypothetical protein [Acidobacteriota bacterium]